MGDQAICHRCRGRGMRWNGGPKELPCYSCRGTGINPRSANANATTWRAEGYPRYERRD